MPHLKHLSDAVLARRRIAALLLGVIALSGCTLTRQAATPPPAVVTATLPEALRTLGIALVETATLPPVITLPEENLTPTEPPGATPTPTIEILALPPTVTLIPTLAASPIPPTATLVPTLAASPVPVADVPTRTPPGPTAAPPLDDGSGGNIPDTGGSQYDLSSLIGVDELPETLYYLSETGGVPQVWRLRVGINHADQLSLSQDGVRAFDVAPDGTLAYLTPGGQMIVNGIPFMPPTNADGTRPQVTALAWSPNGDWLAYTLQTSGVAENQYPSDGTWIDNRQGTQSLLEANTYSPRVIFIGPLEWRPNGSEVLAHVETDGGTAAARLNITTGAMTPLWDASLLTPGSYRRAHWAVNGNAILLSGGGALFRVEPDAQTPPAVLTPDGAGLTVIDDAQQFANGTITFAATDGSGAQRLYVIPPGQTTPVSVTDVLTTTGRVDFLWDSFGQQTLVVVYDSAEARYGTAYLRDDANVLHDLTALTGPAGAPRWGPAFKAGDAARIYTTQGETLNVRDNPGGTVLIELVNGSRVTVTGGPRTADGFRWWKIQTPNGVSGWVVEAVTDDRGLRLRTLLPID